MADRGSVTIRPAKPGDLAAVRVLLREYQQWLGVDLSFQDFAHELQDLPGSYGPPGGALLIARNREEPMGMIGLRRLDGDRAEMKRLFVRPTFRGTGLGRQLITSILNEARTRGYSEVVLDTLPVMHHAHRLYGAFGFREIAPYYPSPVPGTKYLGLKL